MATPVFACGFECGVSGSYGSHIGNITSGVTFDTATKRSGARSLRIQGSSSAIRYAPAGHYPGTIQRLYIYVSTVPSSDWMLHEARRFTDAGTGITYACGLAYKSSDGKVYAAMMNTASGAWTWGSTGVTLATGAWVRLDDRVTLYGGQNVTVGQVGGSAVADLAYTPIGSTTWYENAVLGDNIHSVTNVDIYFDDWLGSNTTADYPLGGGYILSYIPNADGTHNIAGSADFYEGTNATPKLNDIYGGGTPRTDAYTYIDERPLPTTSVDFLNAVAPANFTDYVSCQFEDSVETPDPRTVEAILVHHDAGGAGTNTWDVYLLRADESTALGTIFSGSTNVGATITYKRAHLATTIVSGAWTKSLLNESRIHFRASDASPDVYLDAIMLEVEYAASDAPPTTDLTPSPATTATAIATPTLQVIGPTQNITPDASAAASAVVSVALAHALTRTPDATATATDVPAPTLYVGPAPQTFAPDAVAATTTATTPTLAHALTLILDAIATPTATPTPTVGLAGAPQTVTPDAAASATAAPVPTVGHALTVASGNAATALVCPAPLVGHSLTIAAAVAAAVTATAAPSLAHTATLASGNAATALDVPAPTVYVGPAPQIVAPAPSTVSTAVAAPGVAHALTLAPSPATAATATPTPTVGVAGVRTLQPDAVVTVAISAQPTLGHQFTFAPDAATTASSAAPATLSLSFTSTPDAVATTTVVAGPSVGLRLTISAPSIAAALDVPIPTVDVIAGERTITPSAAAATTAIAEPTLQVLGITTLAPAPVVSATAAIVPSLALIVSLAPASVPSATAVVSVALAHTRTLALAATPALARAIAVWVQVGPVQVGTPGIHLVTTRHGGSALTTIVGGVGVTTRAGGVRHIATGKGGITGDIAAGKVKV